MQFWPPWCWFTHWNELVLIPVGVGVRNGIAVLSHHQSGNFLPTTPQKALTEELAITPLVSLASTRSLLTFFLCPRWLGFSTLNFRDLHGEDPHSSSQGGSYFAMANGVWSQKSLAWLCSGLECMVKYSRKHQDWLPSAQISVPMLGNGSMLVPPVLPHLPKRPFCLSQMLSKQEKCFFLCNPADPYTMLPTPRSLSFFPSWAPPSLPGTTLWMVWTS